MLDKMDVIKKTAGFLQIQCDPSLSPAFLLLHFIESFSKRNLKIVFVSNHTSTAAIRIMCAKMMIRLNESQFKFMPLYTLLDGSFDGSAFLRSIEMKLHEALNAGDEALVIFDDLDSVRQLCADGLPPLTEIQLMLRLRSRLSINSLIVAVSCSASHSYCAFDKILRLNPIGTGFGANVTGEKSHAPVAQYYCEDFLNTHIKCQKEDHIMRMKEYEREKRLLKRKLRKAAAVAAPDEPNADL